jgi:hypothetical protein
LLAPPIKKAPRYLEELFFFEDDEIETFAVGSGLF